MKDSDKLFIISAVLIPVFLITINYPAIVEFYEYTVPLNSLKAIHGEYSLDPDIFQKILSEEGSSCYTTPSGNYFCYKKPRFYNNYGVSYIRAENGVDGEMHFEPTSLGYSYFTMQNITRIDDDSALITFGNRNFKKIQDTFEFSATIRKFDTFVSNCAKDDGTIVDIVQFLGIQKINGTDYFVSWHTAAESKDGVRCDYPQIIQHSIGHRFSDI